MIRVSAFSAALLLVLGGPLLGRSRADVAPPDSCSSVGAACSNAGASANGAGLCSATKCQRATPSGPMEYDCNRCLTADMAGASTKGDSSCSAVGGGADALALALAAFGAAGLRRSVRR